MLAVLNTILLYILIQIQSSSMIVLNMALLLTSIELMFGFDNELLPLRSSRRKTLLR